MPYADPLKKKLNDAKYRSSPDRKELDKLRCRRRRKETPELTRATTKRYRDKNPDKVRTMISNWRERNEQRVKNSNAAWRAANDEKHRTYNLNWKLENAERCREVNAKWTKANAGKVNATTARRSAAKLRATPSWVDLAEIEKLYIEAARLTVETGIPHQVDHIYPLRNPSCCGLHVPWNLQILTGTENRKKGNRLPS